jgi:sec-independent protein translocase protein TatB
MSFGEISLIFVLTLVVFGPKQLPTIAAHIGLFIGRIRRSYDKLKQEIYHHSGMAEINKVK